MCFKCTPDEQRRQKLAIDECVADVRRAAKAWAARDHQLAGFLLDRMTRHPDLAGLCLAALANQVAVAGWAPDLTRPMVLRDSDREPFTDEAMRLVRLCIAGLQAQGSTLVDVLPVTEQGVDHIENVAAELFRLLLLAVQHRVAVTPRKAG